MEQKTSHDSGIHQALLGEPDWARYDPRVSVELIVASCRSKSDAVIDVGAGASTLVDALLAQQFTDITLLDESGAGLLQARARLGVTAVQYVNEELTSWVPTRAYDVWHDRGLFQLLTSLPERRAYKVSLGAAVRRGGHVILAAFAERGEEQREAVSLRRYSAAALINEFDGLLEPVETRSQRCMTARGVEHTFVFVRFRRA